MPERKNKGVATDQTTHRAPHFRHSQERSHVCSSGASFCLRQCKYTARNTSDPKIIRMPKPKAAALEGAITCIKPGAIECKYANTNRKIVVANRKTIKGTRQPNTPPRKDGVAGGATLCARKVCWELLPPKTPTCPPVVTPIPETLPVAVPDIHNMR